MALLATLASLFYSLPLIAASIFGIGFVIAFHEFGHFLFGKLFGVNIPSFSIGFGPRLLKKKICGTEFSISLIPIGGYVEAESGDPENPSSTSIEAKPYWQKICIVGGGILFNIILSYVFFVGLSWNGIPENSFFSRPDAHTIHAVQDDSAAQKAGLQAKDTIIGIDEKDFSRDLSGLLSYIGCHPDKDVSITIVRDNVHHTLSAHLAPKKIKGKDIGSLGIYFGFKAIPGVPFVEALKQGFELVSILFTSTLISFKGALTRRSAEGLSGPLMMISIVATKMKEGFSLFFLLLAFISVGLAVLNLFPLPILDGGQALIYTIEAILRRPLPERLKEMVGYTCWIGMMGLFLYLTFKDAILLCFH